jgi:hypothetical protein
MFDFGQEDVEEPEEPELEEDSSVVEEATEELPMVVVEEVVQNITVEPGSLDIIRVPYNRSQTEPELYAIKVGSSIAEWKWLEPEQIQLMRQQVLVLVDTKEMG